MFSERISSLFPIPCEKLNTLIYKVIEGNNTCYLKQIPFPPKPCDKDDGIIVFLCENWVWWHGITCQRSIYRRQLGGYMNKGKSFIVWGFFYYEAI